MPAAGPASAPSSPRADVAASRDVLSLQLMALRNLTLSRLDAQACPSAAWWAGHAAWWQERWVTRHLQRTRGPASEGGVALASILPGADELFGGTEPGFRPDLPIDDASLRSYLAETFETVQELLARCEPDGSALYYFHAAHWVEARCAEAMAQACAEAQLALPGGEPMAPSVHPPREPIYCPSQRFVLGAPAAAGFVPPHEAGCLELQLPEFEIDAQPVSWASYAEFVADSGYDDPSHWTSEGWAWLQADGARAPKDVEQTRGQVVARRFGSVRREAMLAPVRHLSQHEARAWCHWAGRRLPTEAEWELAAKHAAGRGFAWGQVWEWTLSPARPYSNAASPQLPPGFAPWPDPASHGVLRGASWLTPAAFALPQARRLHALADSRAFCGFRSCAL
jgi:gamma-glutamyl hercynylcysteine S-oxide synthase